MSVEGWQIIAIVGIVSTVVIVMVVIRPWSFYLAMACLTFVVTMYIAARLCFMFFGLFAGRRPWNQKHGSTGIQTYDRHECSPISQ